MSKATDQPTKPDIARMSARLRARTCAFLKCPPFDKLPPHEQIRIDVIGALMLEVSDLREAQLAGRSDVDIGRLVEAGEALQRLLQPGVFENSAIAEQDARQRMRAVINAIAPALAAEDAERERLEAQAADDPEPAAPDPPPEPEPPSDQPAAAAPPSNVQYLSQRRQADGPPPQHYLKRSDHDFEVPHWPLPKDYR
jgi:hypothetical protein